MADSVTPQCPILGHLLRRGGLMKRFSTVLFVLLLWGGSSVKGDEGRIPLFQPTTITASGHYVLTRDIGVAGSDAIVISASNVVLDLNGNTVASSSRGFGATGVLIAIAASSNVEVRNGRLIGGSRGVNATGGRVILRDIDVQDSADAGIRLVGMGFAEVSNCRLNSVNASYGFPSDDAALVVDAQTGRVTNNSVSQTFFTGIKVSNFTGGIIEGNLVEFASSVNISVGQGISVEGGGGNRVEGNVARSTHGPGMAINSPNTLVRKNVVWGNNETGMAISSNGNQVIDNVISATNQESAVGLLVFGSRNVIKGNQIEGNFGNGIWIFTSQNNLIDDNNSGGNWGPGSCGIRFENSGGHVYRNNVLLGNNIDGGPVCGAANTDAGGNIP